MSDSMPRTPDGAAPTAQSERNTALDSLRGFALLGVLLMNIVGLGMYVTAYNDPTVTGGATGPNLGVWVVLHVLAEGKMRALFSLVFGAGVVLLTSRLESRADVGDIYYRRTLWLLLFGIVHAYLLWHGDILYPYALCALVLYPFRKMSARGLLIIGVVTLLLLAGWYVVMGVMQRSLLEKGHAAEHAQQAGETLSQEQKDDLRAWEDWHRFHRPDAEALEKDAAKWRGSPLEVIKARAALVWKWHSVPYYHPWNWDIWAMMFLGMALMKLGVLGAERSVRFYSTLALAGYAVGIPMNGYSAWTIVKSGFDPATLAFASSTYDIGRLSIALAHLGVIMLLCKTGWLGWLMRSFGAIGQMAFSNYIFHSVVCAFLFTGYGFALYGRLQRYELYYVVAAIWVFQMIVSPIWLRHFLFGPMEWLWRSLTYWKRQPMRRVA
jgi:uncharacterized protein